ncbi:MAG: hypothetical protein HKN46_10195 [Acidimicrobiia bacterium]|nr:hypothetical protein [Acidimicrobiia bacterium]
MNLTLDLPDGPLRRRVARILEAFPDIAVTSEGGTRAAIGDGDIPLPAEPIAHLLDLLAESLEARTGEAPERRARTLADSPLAGGTAVSFPPPTGTLWAEDVGGILLAPTEGTHSSALVSNGAGAYAVADERDFLEAIMTAAPIVAAATRTGELAAARQCGLGIAEQA